MTDSVEDWINGFYELNPAAARHEDEVKAKKPASTLTLAMELPAMDYKDRDFYANLSEEHKKEAELANVNVVIAGHMSSDSLGVNLLMDELEKQGIEIVPCSGFTRFSRV